MKRGELYAYSRHWLNLRPMYAFGEFMLDNFPLFVSDGIVWGAAKIAHRSSPNQRASIAANVRHVLTTLEPGKNGADLDRRVETLVHDIFINRGRFFTDLSIMAGKRRLDGVFRFEMCGAWEALQKRIAGGQGAIVVSAHLGNWFGGGYLLARKGISVRSVMFKNHAGDFMDRKAAARTGVKQSFVEDDPMVMMEIIRAVRRGEVLAMLADKPWDSRGLEVPFFGRPSRFALGPVRFARMAGVPIFPAFCTWKRYRRYEAVLCDPIEVGPGDPDVAEREALAKIAVQVERKVAENLPVWFNFTPAWTGS